MKSKFIKSIAVLLCMLTICVVFAGCTQQNTNKATEPDIITAPATEAVVTEPLKDNLSFVPYTEYNLEEDTEVKNIILMIGDGMGENIIENAEIIKGDKLAMRGMPYKCYVTTDSLDGTTDSAAASTAMSCGVKTHNQYIGVDENKEAVETIIEFSKARGLKTGVVATQIIPHATPAGMIAHTDYRGLFNVILKQMINANVDVMYGGGSEYTDTAKMQQRIENSGYTYIKTADELYNNSLETPVIGAFNWGGMYAGNLPSLTDMTASALELLEGEDGFFLMVEESYIDITEADMDMEGTIKEMQSFDKCIDYTLSWAETHPGTLVIVTADHETGGVIVPEDRKPESVNNDCFTSDGEHTSTNVALFAAGAKSGELFTEDMIDNTDIAKIMRQALNDTYGEAEVKFLNEVSQ
ncbi:MAG: alkaline phosphatase [Clostridia bacterium]|nr:alkaline phosphatase [Clostridia bacterium]